MRGYLDRGYNVVKMKIGCAPLAENRDRLRQDAARVSAVLVRGGRRSARLRAAGSTCRILSGPDGDGREPVQPPGCAQPDPLRRHAAGPRLAAVRLRAVLRAVRVSA